MGITERKLKELEALFDEHDTVSPEMVVDFAKSNHDSELHGHFEWDDAKAGHAYRLVQARQILRIFVEESPVTNASVRVFVSLPDDRHGENQGYRRMSSVMASEIMRKQLLNMAIKESLTFQNKYAALEEMAAVFSEMQKVKAKHA